MTSLNYYVYFVCKYIYSGHNQEKCYLGTFYNTITPFFFFDFISGYITTVLSGYITLQSKSEPNVFYHHHSHLVKFVF